MYKDTKKRISSITKMHLFIVTTQLFETRKKRIVSFSNNVFILSISSRAYIIFSVLQLSIIIY